MSIYFLELPAWRFEASVDDATGEYRIAALRGAETCFVRTGSDTTALLNACHRDAVAFEQADAAVRL